MPNGGQLTFATSKAKGDEIPPNSGNLAAEYVRLNVTDNGCGMDEATLQRIFEPFFTTKPRGKGTGLGMPVVYGLMQSHHGLIDVQSAPGRGTSISLFFPVPEQPAPSQNEAFSITPRSVDGSETVLLVDDEDDVRRLLETFLKRHGYRVLSATNGEAALEIMPRPPEEVHILFSDVGLPTIDGFELGRRARLIQPKLKVVLCSGYTDANLKMRMAEDGIEGFVAKPYNTKEMLQTFRAVLEKK
jgi:CheY-like chemotaxis protein